MSVRIAIIGAGIMGADHARIVAEDIPGATLQVVCDASGDRAQKVADAYGATHATSDPFGAIADHDVDAVLIASPDKTHAAFTLAAIASGKPVLCEKPLSQSSSECLDIIESEVKKGQRLLQLGFMRRFDPSYRAMKAALDEGSLGRALMMHNFHRNVEAPADFTGQMAITNSAPHEFDIARFILGADFTAITAFQPASVDANRTGAPVFMVLETSSGQLVNIEVNNNASYGYDVRGELVGERGSVMLSSPIHARYNTALTSMERYALDWRPRFAEAYRLQDKAFVAFVQTGTFPAVASDAWDGFRAAQIAEAGVRSLAQGGRVEVTATESPALYLR